MKPDRTAKILKWKGLKNCKANRRKGARCCKDCPFAEEIQKAERIQKLSEVEDNGNSS